MEKKTNPAQYAGNALPACLARALAPMAPPQSVIHQIIQEDDLLTADRALDLQVRMQNLPGALV